MADAADQIAPQRWRELRTIVNGAINGADPEGLLKIGAPDDEYKSEVEQLTELVSRRSPTADDVLSTWTQWFGPDNNLVRKQPVLDQLVHALEDARQRWLAASAD